MGSGESTTRKVSFGLDEDERVHILRGIKLSEDVLQRMRNASQTPTSHKENPVSHTPSKFQQSTQSGPTVSENTEELKRRHEQEQAAIQEELARIARMEREAVRQDVSRVMQREKLHTLQEAERAKRLAKQLETKETELKALEAFYREQIDQLEKRNLNHFKTCTEQFHISADQIEAKITTRNTDPACRDLQARILHCYRENRDQTLRCSELAKDYMRCVDTAKKNLLVNHG